MKKSYFVLFLLMLGADNFLFCSESISNLKRITLIVEEKEEAIFKSPTDMQFLQNYLFIVDNAYHRILKFKLQEGKMAFITSIGKHGQGPGDLQLPLRISLENDVIGIQDQSGISLFDLNGKFVAKFRVFSGIIDFLMTNNKIFCVVANPNHPNLIEVYSLDGKRLYAFGKKEEIIRYDYNVIRGISPVTLEMVIFDGILLSDSQEVYLINRRFGQITKFSHSGERLRQEEIISFFGENEAKKADENKNLFLRGRYDPFTMKGAVPQNYIFRSARILKERIYFLTDQWNFVNKRRNNFIEIRAFDKDNLKLISVYTGPISEDERFLAFALYEENKNPQFLVLVDSPEGHKIYKYYLP